MFGFSYDYFLDVVKYCDILWFQHECLTPAWRVSSGLQALAQIHRYGNIMMSQNYLIMMSALYYLS